VECRPALLGALIGLEAFADYSGSVKGQAMKFFNKPRGQGNFSHEEPANWRER